MQGVICRSAPAWRQWEAEIDDACRGAIRLGESNEDNPRLSFRNSLTLVLDRSSDVWKRTLELYEVRNQIAHGDVRHAGIALPAEIEGFRRFQSSLARK